MQVAVKNGAIITFECNSLKLLYPNGTKFNIKENEHWYNVHNVVSSKIALYLEQWHKIWENYNERDIINYQKKLM